MIFDECVKTIQWEKDSVFNKWYWENCISTCKRMKLDTYILYIKINLNIRTKTVKLLEESIWESFMTLDLAIISWILHQKHRQQQKDKLYFIKI